MKKESEEALKQQARALSSVTGMRIKLHVREMPLAPPPSPLPHMRHPA